MWVSCILSKFYIKPQLFSCFHVNMLVVSYRNSTSNHNMRGNTHSADWVVSYRNSTSNHNPVAPGGFAATLYLIEILHQTTTLVKIAAVAYRCILSKFYIKPQQRVRHKIGHSCCILSKFYIKPQPLGGKCFINRGLYLIEILHQTTTRTPQAVIYKSCILSKFYIKPQRGNKLSTSPELYLIEILHQTTTPSSVYMYSKSLYLIEILHQTTTNDEELGVIRSCILSKFYIKPQLSHHRSRNRFVVSYRNSTSNHNGITLQVSGASVVSYRNSTSNHNSAHG